MRERIEEAETKRQRDKIIGVRVRQDEHDTIAQKAKRVGVPTSTYLRMLGTGLRPDLEAVSKALAEVERDVEKSIDALRRLKKLSKGEKRERLLRDLEGLLKQINREVSETQGSEPDPLP